LRATDRYKNINTVTKGEKSLPKNGYCGVPGVFRTLLLTISVFPKREVMPRSPVLSGPVAEVTADLAKIFVNWATAVGASNQP
jgi:hypothetical protein